MTREEQKEQILAEGKKRFQHIMEYTQVSSPLTEDGPDEDDPNEMGPQDDNAMGGAPDPTMGGEQQGPDTMGGQDPAMGGAQQGPDAMGGQNPEMGGQDPNAQPEQDPNAQGAPGFAPQEDASDDAQEDIEDEPEEGDDIDSDDEVLDIDDLTDYQQKTAKGMGKISSEIKDLKDLISQFQSAVDTNNAGIEDLKREIERRNPDAQEKMSLRQKKSGPFTQSVEGYWAEDAPENYSTEDDNNGEDDPKYTITQADIDDMTDYRGISKSMDSSNFGSLKDILGDF